MLETEGSEFGHFFLDFPVHESILAMFAAIRLILAEMPRNTNPVKACANAGGLPLIHKSRGNLSRLEACHVAGQGCLVPPPVFRYNRADLRPFPNLFTDCEPMTDFTISLEKALALRDKGTLLIDARTPAEYGEATIPGAVNVPIFDDEERARVGTLYKEEGKGAAKRLAMELVAPRIPALVAQVEASAGYQYRPRRRN
jgi:hypothetical protein